MHKSVTGNKSFRPLRLLILSYLIIALLLNGCDSPSPTKAVEKAPAPTAAQPLPQPTAAPEKATEEPTEAPTEQVGESGWVLVESKYFQSSSDVDILGGPVKSTQTGTGAVLLDYFRDEGVHGNMLFSVSRKIEGGGSVAEAIWRVIWTDPGEFLPAGQQASLYIEHELIADWGTPRVSVNFDMPDMAPGYSGSSPIRFLHEHGGDNPYRDLRAEVSGAKETMYTEKPLPEGKAGDRRAIYINFGQGYGMRYTYEWQTNVILDSPETTTTADSHNGWLLVESKYFQSTSDVDILGGPVKSTQTGTGAVLLDYYRDEGVHGNMLFTVRRTDGNGNYLVGSSWRVVWMDPDKFLPAGQQASLYIEHELIADWGTPAVSANFDMPDMEPNRVSSSPIRFLHEHGTDNPYKDTRAEVFNAKETLYTEKPLPEGKPGDRRAIYINFGQGYGMRYTYEWQP